MSFALSKFGVTLLNWFLWWSRSWGGGAGLGVGVQCRHVCGGVDECPPDGVLVSLLTARSLLTFALKGALSLCVIVGGLQHSELNLNCCAKRK